MEWRNGDLYRAILAKHGEGYTKDLRSAIYSFPWKFFLADYHASESKDVITRSLPEDKIQARIELLKSLLPGREGPERNRIKIAMFESEAHIIAYAQSIHSVADILASVIYYAFNLKTIPLKRNSLSRVKSVLQKHSEYFPLVERIASLLSSTTFKYLVAYTNTIKHRQLIDTSFRVSMNALTHDGVIIKAFEYDGNVYA
jgi:hypothetical protein